MYYIHAGKQTVGKHFHCFQPDISAIFRSPFMIPKDNHSQQPDRLMPDPKILTITNPRTLNELYEGVMRFYSNPSEAKRIYPWADRFVCGMPLAPWQRPVVWDEDMQIRFIDAIWARVDTGSYMINKWVEFVGDGPEIRYPSDIVIDGQQRLTSIERYFRNEIPATSADGRRLLFSEITEADRRAFRSRTFPRTSVHTNDEQLLREAYDMRAFGGVRHTEDQRAVQKEDSARLSDRSRTGWEKQRRRLNGK
jgi:hypothetical protein